MAEHNRSLTGGGMGLSGTLLTIFLVLKLTGVISWSWWWVLSPIWIGAIVEILSLILLALFVKSSDEE